MTKRWLLGGVLVGVILVLSFGSLGLRLGVPWIKNSLSSAEAQTVPPEIDVSQSDQLVYPRLSLTAPLIDSPSTDPTQQANWPRLLDDLRRGVAMTYSQPSFEQADTVFVSGHSSQILPQRYATVFAPLAMAKVGDRFTLLNSNRAYAYEVKEIKKVLPTDLPAFFRYDDLNDGKQRAILVTCWPLYTTRERLLVVGERLF